MSANGRCIAMWSGPRNISTAMMRAWENRSDTQVIDEPFYAHYLAHTGKDHPMRDAIIQQGVTDWHAVVDRITTLPAEGILYQKHISTHWLDHFSTHWLDQLDHVFLIRDPEAVAASYANKRESVTASDLGYAQQAALFAMVSDSSGKRPVVIDSKRFLDNPESQLKATCQELDIEFDEAMLKWPAGSRKSDGVWGSHWYDAVNKSTGFSPARNQPPLLDEQLLQIAESCKPYYQAMREHAL